MQPEADDQREREGEVALLRRAPDRQALGEVVQADPRGDGDRQVRRGEAGTERRTAHVVDEAEQADPKAADEHAEEQRQRSRLGPDRVLDRLDRVLDDVDEEEEEDPDGEGVEERHVARRHDPDAGQRQPEEDREAGDRAEDHRFRERH